MKLELVEISEDALFASKGDGPLSGTNAPPAPDTWETFRSGKRATRANPCAPEFPLDHSYDQENIQANNIYDCADSEEEIKQEAATESGAPLRTVTLQVARSATIREVKLMLQQSTFSPQEQINVFYRGRQLGDDWHVSTSMSASERLVFTRSRHCGNIRVIGLEALARMTPKSQAAIRSLLREVNEGFEAGMSPDLSEEGSGGTYFLKNKAGCRVACFKPRDEEPCAENNPRGVINAAQRDGVLVGESSLREVAAFITDEGSFSGVPETILVEMAHPDFHYRGQKMFAKMGSLQRYVQGECASDLSPHLFPVDEVHKIGILDIRLLNADRNDANLLVSRLPKADPASGPRHGSHSYDSDASNMPPPPALRKPRSYSSSSHADFEYSLVPIDHGFCLPDRLRVGWCDLCWLDWPQARKPFSEATKAWVRAYDVDANVARLRNELNIREPCLRLVKIAGMLLKMGVEAGLCLHDIASILVRQDIDAPSVLENQVTRSIELANMMLRNSRVKGASPRTASPALCGMRSPRSRRATLSSVVLPECTGDAWESSFSITSGAPIYEPNVELSLPSKARSGMSGHAASSAAMKDPATATSTCSPPSSLGTLRAEAASRQSNEGNALGQADRDSSTASTGSFDSGSQPTSTSPSSTLSGLSGGLDLTVCSSSSQAASDSGTDFAEEQGSLSASLSASRPILLRINSGGSLLHSSGPWQGNSAPEATKPGFRLRFRSTPKEGLPELALDDEDPRLTKSWGRSMASRRQTAGPAVSLAGLGISDALEDEDTYGALPEHEGYGSGDIDDQRRNSVDSSAPKQGLFEKYFFEYLERLVQDVILCVQTHRKSDNSLFRRSSSRHLTSPHRVLENRGRCESMASFFTESPTNIEQEPEEGPKLVRSESLPMDLPVVLGRETKQPRSPRRTNPLASASRAALLWSSTAATSGAAEHDVDHSHRSGLAARGKDSADWTKHAASQDAPSQGLERFHSIAQRGAHGVDAACRERAKPASSGTTKAEGHKTGILCSPVAFTKHVRSALTPSSPDKSSQSATVTPKPPPAQSTSAKSRLGWFGAHNKQRLPLR